MIRPVDEIITRNKFGNPSQTGFNRRVVIINFMTVQTESGFQAQRIARPQSYRLYAKFFSCFKDSIPKFVRIFIIGVYFTSTGTSVARSRKNHFVYSGKRYLFKSIVLHIGHIIRSQFLHGTQRKGALNR